jgi:hypothetical protein
VLNDASQTAFWARLAGSGVDSTNDDRASFFNSLGQLVFAAQFTDSTAGIFVSNRVVVPEPNTLLILAAIIVAGLFWRRRTATYPV